MQNTADWLASSLTEGELWHERSALYCLNHGWRGLARWHEAEACGDSKHRRCFSKFIMDHMCVVPQTDLSKSARATQYQIPAQANILEHLQQWFDREIGYSNQLKEHIARLAQSKHYSMYKKLCEYLCDLENEILYVKILFDNITYGKTEHHIAQKNQDLHKYFENEYNGGLINFAIV